MKKKVPLFILPLLFLLRIALLWVPGDVAEKPSPTTIIKNHGSPLDSLAVAQCKLSPNAFLAIVLPKAYDHHDLVRKACSEIGTVLYEKSILLEENGPINYVKNAYDHLNDHPHKWTNNERAIIKQTKKRFSNGRPIHVFLFTAPGQDEVVAWKKNVRKRMGMGTIGLHTTDNHKETIALAQVLFHENSIRFMNKSPSHHNQRFLTMIDDFRRNIEKQGLNPEAFCFTGKAVLVAYGLADVEELTTLPHVYANDEDEEVQKAVHDPSKYFYFNRMKFLTLESTF